MDFHVRHANWSRADQTHVFVTIDLPWNSPLHLWPQFKLLISTQNHNQKLIKWVNFRFDNDIRFAAQRTEKITASNKLFSFAFNLQWKHLILIELVARRKSDEFASIDRSRTPSMEKRLVANEARVLVRAVAWTLRHAMMLRNFDARWRAQCKLFSDLSLRWTDSPAHRWRSLPFAWSCSLKLRSFGSRLIEVTLAASACRMNIFVQTKRCHESDAAALLIFFRHVNCCPMNKWLKDEIYVGQSADKMRR